MGLKKQFLKSKNVCKVTFEVASEEIDAQNITLVGDFNDWNETQLEMKKYKNGKFKAVVNLEKDKEYQFKYLIDGEKWENDFEADSYVANHHGGENSVVSTK
jgi:1,4-alpha-glucan branching enzyme